MGKDVWERVEDYEALIPVLEEKSEQLDKLVPLVIEYNKLRDEEWDFHDKHGCNGDFWEEEDYKEHDAILAAIADCRRNLRNLLAEITYDKDLKF